MPPHEKACICVQCLDSLAAAVDELEKMAMAAQIQASWHGWNLDEQPQWAGHDPSLPTVPQCSWHLWFAQDDLPRRQLILAKVDKPRHKFVYSSGEFSRPYRIGVTLQI
jgi:hypothetical protein